MHTNSLKQGTQIESFYTVTFGRLNTLKLGILGLFYAYCSYPRLIIEVFIRRDFGERYFNMASATTVAVILFYLPTTIFSGTDPSGHGNTGFIQHYLSWYIFVILFLVRSYRHHKDLKRQPSVFDFAKFSLSSGKINSFFWNVKNIGMEVNVRSIECFIEPAAAFIAGLALLILGQYIGGVIIVCSIFYCLSYVAAYVMGDHYMMDMIDQRICNRELKRTFVDDIEELDQSDDSGFCYRGKKPNSKAMRREILNVMIGTEEILEVK